MNITLICDRCGAGVLLDDTPTGTVTRKGDYTLFHGVCICGISWRLYFRKKDVFFIAEEVKKK